MKFNIHIPQKEIIESGLPLDFYDSVILCAMYHLFSSSGIEDYFCGKYNWKWISHQLVLEDLPLLGSFNKDGSFKPMSTDSIYRRIKKLCKLKLLESAPFSKAKKKTYYRPLEALDQLFRGEIQGERNIGYKSEVNKNNNIGYKSELTSDINPNGSKITSDINPKDYNTKFNYNTKDNNITFVEFQENSPELKEILKKANEEKINFSEILDQAIEENPEPTLEEIDKDINSEFVDCKVNNCLDMPEWLLDLCTENCCTELWKFKKLPSSKWIFKKIKEHGEVFVKEVFLNIEEYCKVNPGYAEKKSQLASVFNTFAKGHDTETMKQAKKIISDKYMELFDEEYNFYKSDQNKIKELLDKVSVDFQIIAQAKPEEEDIINSFKLLIDNLPEKYHQASQFKVAFIHYNYQQIKNQIKNGKQTAKRANASKINYNKLPF